MTKCVFTASGINAIKHPLGLFKASPRACLKHRRAPSPGHPPGTGADDGGVSQRGQRRRQRRGVAVALQLGGRRHSSLQEGVALGTLHRHVRGPQQLPQPPRSRQVPAQGRLAGDVEPGAQPALPRAQQRDLRQEMNVSRKQPLKYPAGPGVKGWGTPALPPSCPKTMGTVVVQPVKACARSQHPSKSPSRWQIKMTVLMGAAGIFQMLATLNKYLLEVEI